MHTMVFLSLIYGKDRKIIKVIQNITQNQQKFLKAIQSVRIIVFGSMEEDTLDL